MLLVIDCGNTNTLFAICDQNKPILQWRISTAPTRTADEYASWLAPLLSLHGMTFSTIKNCVISTVVPQSLFHLRNLCKRYLQTSADVIGETIIPNIQVNLQNPREAGADRLVNAVGGFVFYGGPLIIIDSGTATTFDVISKTGSFEGGMICPGLSLSALALHNAAAKLPRVEIKQTDTVIAKNTVSAMQAGVFWGYVSLIEGLIKRIKHEYKSEMTVLATGGIVPLFEGITQEINIFDPDLTVKGMLEIYKRKSVS